MTDTKHHELHPSEVDRAKAEAEKFRAEAAAATVTDESNAKKAVAEAAKFKAEIHELELQARSYEFELKAKQHDSDRNEEKRRKELAAHEYHHVFMFIESVTDASAKKCMDQLTLWQRTDSTPEDIEIVFNSPGGSVTAGLALWDNIQAIRAAGHKVTTSTVGMAASMAGILLQAGDIRIMGKESWLLIHQVSFGASGSFGEVEDTTKWVDRIQDRVLDIFASRSKMSKAQIKRKWNRTDWWISSDEALKLGFVDETR